MLLLEQLEQLVQLEQPVQLERCPMLHSASCCLELHHLAEHLLELASHLLVQHSSYSAHLAPTAAA